MRSAVVGRLVSLTVVAAVLAATALPASAGADTFRVTRHDDPRPGRCKPDDCSVREAIRAANARRGRDVVVLPDRRPRYELSRPNAGRGGEDANNRGDLDVIDPVTIRHGPGGAAIIDARGVARVLELQPDAATKVVRIMLTGGDAARDLPAADAGPSATPAPPADAGGGVLALAPLRLVRSAVLSSRAAAGGGIFAAGPLSLRRTAVRRNRAAAGAGGGIEARGGRVRISRSTVAGNRAAEGGGGGLALSDGALRLSRSTVAGNLSRGAAGGVRLVGAEARIAQSTVDDNAARRSGGGIHQSGSTVAVVDSTITRNRAGASGGGVFSSAGGGEVVLNSVTVARNVANTSRRAVLGGGLSAKGGTFRVVNSIVALNRSAARPSDCHGAFDSLGANLVGTVAGCRGFVGSALIGANPRLGSLRDNGGPTETLALKRNSPAIGEAGKARAPRFDQRGRRRDSHPDIGAFERLGRR